jgi:hypothetical protein
MDDGDEWDRADLPPAATEVEFAPAGRALGGCLMRLVFLVLLAFMALIFAISLMGGSLLRLFGFW